MKRIALVAAVFALAACGPRDSDRMATDTGAPALMPAPADTADTLYMRDTLSDTLRTPTTTTP